MNMSRVAVVFGAALAVATLLPGCDRKGDFSLTDKDKESIRKDVAESVRREIQQAIGSPPLFARRDSNDQLSIGGLQTWLATESGTSKTVVGLECSRAHAPYISQYKTFFSGASVLKQDTYADWHPDDGDVYVNTQAVPGVAQRPWTWKWHVIVIKTVAIGVDARHAVVLPGAGANSNELYVICLDGDVSPTQQNGGVWVRKVGADPSTNPDIKLTDEEMFTTVRFDTSGGWTADAAKKIDASHPAYERMKAVMKMAKDHGFDTFTSPSNPGTPGGTGTPNSSSTPGGAGGSQ